MKLYLTEKVSGVESEEQSKLAAHREKVRRITKSILDLALERQNLSLKIGETKKALGQAIENPEVERVLLSNMRSYAKEVGLDEYLAASLVSSLIESSKIAQREKLFQPEIRRHLQTAGIRRIGIVGAGRMGSWFGKYFLKVGADVSLFDQDKKQGRELSSELGCGSAASIEELSAESDLFLFAVPIRKTPREIEKLVEVISAHNKSGSETVRILEISSIKAELSRAGLFRKKSSSSKSKIDLYSIHPLFGPGSQFFGKSTVIQVYPNDPTFVRGLFPHFDYFYMDWRLHDKMMSRVLTLPHALSLVFSNALSHDHLKKSELRVAKQLHGPSFDVLMDLSQRVLRENPEVYYEIQKTNQYGSKMLNRARVSFDELLTSLETQARFEEYFLESKSSLSSES